MKNFNTFITEKLTLNDISKMQIKGKWLDAKQFNITDLCSGNIVQREDRQRFICTTIEIARERFSYLKNIAYIYDFILISDHGTYLRLNSYTGTFPLHKTTSKFNIDKINNRKKNYKNYTEVLEDCNKLYSF